ncbi:hypothetical protein Bdt_0701 [Bdellovibrio bacteriovorus str. Tiberius]|uniref:Uncharacterized protein n=1 Tax=Bdellovibrio bacteriovorus str. Tiberius TaxID=1069642 RepID=K7YS27_BDEBC|nr:hypothetical protein Bdt_0701 [Bdellovibrio bacteriovorus str. Tiberius]
MGTRWESAAETAEFQNWKTCSINPNSPSTDLLCEVSIPEAQLYYSEVQFKMGSLQPAYCPILSFTPYYYLRSDDAPQDSPGPPDAQGNPTTVTTGGYVPPGAEPTSSPLNCESGTLPSLCFGGAAPIMVEDFPKNNGNYFLTSVQESHGYVLESSNSLRYYGSAKVNYTTTNNLSEVNRAIPVVGGLKERAANSFQDYEITCKSYWGEKLFGIKLILSDENWDDSGGLDHYTDWN